MHPNEIRKATKFTLKTFTTLPLHIPDHLVAKERGDYLENKLFEFLKSYTKFPTYKGLISFLTKKQRAKFGKIFNAEDLGFFVPMDLIHHFPPACIITQPFGNNKSPDIMLIIKGQVFCIECKAYKVSPVFGREPIKKGFFYILASGGQVEFYHGYEAEHPLSDKEVVEKMAFIREHILDLRRLVSGKTFNVFGMKRKWKFNFGAIWALVDE